MGLCPQFSALCTCLHAISFQLYWYSKLTRFCLRKGGASVQAGYTITSWITTSFAEQVLADWAFADRSVCGSSVCNRTSITKAQRRVQAVEPCSKSIKHFPTWSDWSDSCCWLWRSILAPPLCSPAQPTRVRAEMKVHICHNLHSRDVTSETACAKRILMCTLVSIMYAFMIFWSKHSVHLD